MIGTHQNPPMIVHLAEEELRQALIFGITLEIVKRRINSLSIIKLILIKSILLMMRKTHGIEKYVVFVVYITMWLLSVGREWKQERG